MSKPIAFTPRSAASPLHLQDSLQSASSDHPENHAEARVAAYELLEQARRQGILDALHGMMGAKDVIIQELAHYASEPESIAALRNLFILTKALGHIEPESLTRVSANLGASMTEQEQGSPPSLWELLKRLNHPDVRRGLSALLRVASAFGRSKQ